MNMVPNPEYSAAPFEAACFDRKGNKLSSIMTSILFDRPVPPRYRKLPDGRFEEVPSHIPAQPK